MQTAMTVQDLGREKIELIKQTVAKGATDLELELFLHACKHTGLDPLMKQIYAIKRWSSADNREVMAFQTGIDGLRLIADRTGQYAGSDEPVFVLGEDGFPDVASVTVYKLVGSLKCAFTHSVRWKEYVQYKQDGTPTSFWAKMPFGQLGKCAESGALRKAFPMELSGLYTHDEMMQADPAPQEATTAQKPLRKPSDILRESERTPSELESQLKASIDAVQKGKVEEGVRAADVLARSDDALDTAEHAEAQRDTSDAAQAWSELIALSETVREASATGNRIEADTAIDVFEKTRLREEVKQKILSIRAKKG